MLFLKMIKKEKKSKNVHSYRSSLFKNTIEAGPRREKTCLRWVANNKGADQPAHTRSLISTFVIHLLESTISQHASSKISIF